MAIFWYRFARPTAANPARVAQSRLGVSAPGRLACYMLLLPVYSLVKQTSSATSYPQRNESSEIAMDNLYTVSQAAQLTGIAKPTVRGYTNRYQRFLSTEATPEQGAERAFTESDLKVLAYIYTQTKAGRTHDQVAEALQAGALDSFDWQPAEQPTDTPEPPESAGEALVPVSRLQAAEYLVRDAQEQREALAEQLSEAQAEALRLRQELGQAQGELAGYQKAQYRAPNWWRALFGGRAETE